MGTRAALMLALLVLLGWGRTEGEERRFHFAGGLADRTVQLELELVDGHLRGRVMEGGTGAAQPLEGRWTSGGRLAFRDALDRGWVGRLTPGPSAPRSLRGMVREGSSTLTLTAEWIAEYVELELRQGSIHTYSSYPFFTHPDLLGLNDEIQADIVGEQLGFFEEGQERLLDGSESAEWSYRNLTRIRFATPDLVSVLARSETHDGSVEHWSYTFARTGGRYRFVTLADLFRRGTPFRDRLEAALLGVRGPSGPARRGQGAAPSLGPEALEVFVVDPDGLTFVIPAAVDGAKAGEPLELTVPYEDVADLLDRSGPLGAILRSAATERRAGAAPPGKDRGAADRSANGEGGHERPSASPQGLPPPAGHDDDSGRDATD